MTSKNYTCRICGEHLSAETETRLITAIQEHVAEQHDLKMTPDDIRDGIKETERQ